MGTGQCPVKRYNRHLRNLIADGNASHPHRLPSLGLDQAGKHTSTSIPRRRLDEGRPEARQHQWRRSPVNPQTPTTQE